MRDMLYPLEQVKQWAMEGQSISSQVVLDMIQEIEYQNKLIELIKTRACWCVIKKAMQDQHTVACMKVQEFLR